jgi:hypothetical protein
MPLDTFAVSGNGPVLVYASTSLDFDKGSATLRPDAKATTDALVGQLALPNVVGIWVRGHVGKDETAFGGTLLEARTKTVVAYLLAKGVQKHLLDAPRGTAPDDSTEVAGTSLIGGSEHSVAVVYAQETRMGPPTPVGPSANTLDTRRKDHQDAVLPPFINSLWVEIGNNATDVDMTTLPHVGKDVPFVDVWRAAFPKDDPQTLRFEFRGSDGFRSSYNPACAKFLTGSQLARARIGVTTHDLSFGDASNLPECYRVRSIVAIHADR